ncbi:MAG: acyltransferase [Mycobacteriales bacterium]
MGPSIRGQRFETPVLAHCAGNQSPGVARHPPRCENSRMKSSFSSLAIRALKAQALTHNRFVRAWRALGDPGPSAWTDYMRRWGRLHHIGEDCSILPSTVFTNPEYVSLGNNVRFSACTILGHDGSIAMLDHALRETLDSVGYVVIRDNVFVGYGAIIMPNVSIGPNAIVAAGSVVTKDVPPNTVVGGVPAAVIADFTEHVERIRVRSRSLPWYELIRQRGPTGFDAELQPELKRQRVEYFFAPDGPASQR